MKQKNEKKKKKKKYFFEILPIKEGEFVGPEVMGIFVGVWNGILVGFTVGSKYKFEKWKKN